MVVVLKARNHKKVVYTKLVDALRHAARIKATGTIEILGSDDRIEIIELRYGRRPGMKKGTWVSCISGYGE